MNHFLEMIAARKPPHVLASHRLCDVTAQQHHGYQSDLIYVVAFLPPANLAPCDFIRHVEQVERVSGDAARVQLVCGDAKVAELELLIFTNEDVERREVTMQYMPAMQRVERAEDC